MDIEKICMGCMRELPRKGVFCTYCGYHHNDAIQKESMHHLRPYSILAGKYLVGKVLGEGGFGITYIGMDLNLEMKVAIKEFYPNGFVTREGAVTSKVSEYAGTSQQTVQKWKDNFIREARTLAKCSNLSGIVGVKDFFQENNTAYIIMEYLEGETLKEHLKKNGGKMPVEEVMSIMRPIITALSKMHELGLIHRDISPDNIMMQPDGSVKLLDLGAARDYAAEGEKSLSVMLKPGYAPEEQYRTKGKQGPWSDVYALCATIYKCITGVTPPESMERMREDCLQKPSMLGVRMDAMQEKTLLKGMEVYAEKRIQNMDELYRSLYENKSAAQALMYPQIHLQKKEVPQAKIQSQPKVQKQTKMQDQPGTQSRSLIKEEPEMIPSQMEEKKNEQQLAQLSDPKEKDDNPNEKMLSFIKHNSSKMTAIMIVVVLCSVFVFMVIGTYGKRAGIQQINKNNVFVVPERKEIEGKALTLGEEATAYQLYGNVVAEMVENNTLPEIQGELIQSENSAVLYMQDCSVAIQDIDTDGVKELIFRFGENSSTQVEQRQIVYKYNVETQSVHLELDVNQLGTFYDNGTFQYVDQNLRGIYSSEAPVVVMMFDSEKARYESVGEIVKWNKAEFPDTAAKGKFPDKTDIDNDGVVYNAIWTDGSSTGFCLNEKEYRLWQEEYFEDTHALDVSYSSISIY